jgi:endoglucanase
MRHEKRILAVCVLLLILCEWICPVEAGGFLRTQGQDMVDEGGKKVPLRGVGLGNWLLPEGYMWRFGDQGDRPRKIEKIVSDLIGQEGADRFWIEFRKGYITEADIQSIAELGFNSVRPALNARRFLTEGANPVYMDEGFELLDNLVRWCRKYNVYVIIDMHGAPGGQTGANIDDSPKDQPELFSDKANQNRLVDLWVKLADRYKDEPHVAGYDLLNEPLPQRTGAADKYRDQVEPLYKRITQAIREKDKRHMITVEGVDWANDWSIFTRPFDGNLFYQFHYYCWDQPTTLKDIGQYLAQRERLNAPVWVGETGEKDNAIYWGTTQLFEACNIGWSFWPWKKMETQNTPYSIKAPEGWEAIRAYSQGKEKPPREAAQKVFDQLLVNIRLENCVYYPDVVNTIFRRVPGKVEGENYGHEGPGKSFFVKDTSRKAEVYRTTEPVQIRPVEAEGSRRRGSGQAVQLGSGEWTAYTAHSLTARDYAGVVKVKAETAPAAILLSVNDRTSELTVADAGWVEVKVDAMPFNEGANRIMLEVTAGEVQVDWLDFK